jgi:DNA polymerase III subunit epsilon
MGPRLSFVAIDFETADPKRDSACAVALVKVQCGQIVDRASYRIRPPRREFTTTWVHGITWKDVRYSPPFQDLWPEIDAFCGGVEFLAAHNAPFDRSVLRACCAEAGIELSEPPFLCTCTVARQMLGLKRVRLPDVCDVLDIPLQHHLAESDAEACARIVMEAEKRMGVGVVRGLVR